MIKIAHFKSGTNIATGISYQLDKLVVNNITYCDTPGLKDVKQHQQAALAITQALKQGGEFLVVFVVTLEAGRVKPEDKSTIEAVLKGAPEITSFGLIINKLSKTVYSRLSSNASEKQSVVDEISKDLGSNAPDVLLLQRNDSLDDKENTFVDLPSLSSFVFQTLIPIVIHQEKVNTVEAGEQYNIAYMRECKTRLEAERKESERIKKQKEAEVTRQQKELEDSRERERVRLEQKLTSERQRLEKEKQDKAAAEEQARQKEQQKREQERLRKAEEQRIQHEQIEAERARNQAAAAASAAAAAAFHHNNNDGCCIL